MQFRRPGKLKVMIELAPLVDVVFLLVIFFAASTTFLDKAGMKLDLPTSTSTSERKVEEITVNLAADGTLVFDQEEVPESELTELLATALDGTDRKMVVLRADTNTSHGDVVRIMDLIKSAGAEAMTIAARAPAE